MNAAATIVPASALPLPVGEGRGEGPRRAVTAARPSLFRRIFDDKPEHSARLRVIALIAALWAALSVIAVGVSPTIPVLAMGALMAGHALSWQRRKKRTPVVSVAVGIFIIAIGVYMRTDLVLAIRGDRIPVAYFLLATAAASSFDLKTRAGLYTQIIASGIVMFFASEIAFGGGFAPLGIVFGLIILAFLALAYLEDEFHGASVVWFRSRFAAGAFWAATGAALLVISGLAFFLLPWNAAQAPQAPRFTIVPFSGAESTGITGITPELAQQARELLARRAGQGGGGDSPSGNAGEGLFGGFSDQLIAELDGQLTSAIELGADDLSLASRVGLPLDPPQFNSSDEAVAFVRSAVSSYWRGRTYDQYDSNDGANGFGKWYATVQDSEVPDSVIAPRRRQSEDDSNRYLQTFFPQRDLGEEVLTGYEPVAAALPRDGNYRPSIQSGSAYQIVSTEPGFNAGDLNADQTGWKGAEYAAIPGDLRSLHGLTGEIIDGAGTDFEKATQIVSYLHQLEYAQGSPSQLRPNAPIDDFIFGEAPGTALDFATAMTLMARSAGLTSRLATGYLPGEYNPLSGASKVTAADEHAWSEIYFKDAGWVPFDATPRPDLPAAAGAPAASGLFGLSNLLDLRIGDSVASAAAKTPGALFAGLRKLVENVQYLLLAVLALVGIGGSIYMILLRINPDLVRKPAPDRFAALPGARRRHVLDTFANAEKAAKSAGFRSRNPTEPHARYAAAAANSLRITHFNLQWLARAAWQAAYNPSDIPADLPLEAEVRLRALKLELRTRTQPTPS